MERALAPIMEDIKRSKSWLQRSKFWSTIYPTQMPERIFLLTEDFEQFARNYRWRAKEKFDRLFRYEQPR